MPIFEIKKTIYTTLMVNCNSLVEAEDWAEKVVATLEISDFDETPPNIELFEADFIQNELKIKEIESDK